MYAYNLKDSMEIIISLISLVVCREKLENRYSFLFVPYISPNDLVTTVGILTNIYLSLFIAIWSEEGFLQGPLDSESAFQLL